jgi:phosphoribosyl-dephospho-CoA transferase
MTPRQPRVHDLIRFDADVLDVAVPAWVTRDHGDVWAVVRRQAASRPEAVSAGVRGRRRAERKAIEVDRGAVRAVVTPESLAIADASALGHAGIAAALAAIATSAAFRDRAWGPAGSTGFQLATGLMTVHAESDLDVVVRADAPIPRTEARAMLQALADLPCRVDCLLETPAGGIALAEWATDFESRSVLLRTAEGPRLTTDPWATVERMPA